MDIVSFSLRTLSDHCKVVTARTLCSKMEYASFSSRIPFLLLDDMFSMMVANTDSQMSARRARSPLCVAHKFPPEHDFGQTAQA